MYGYVTPKKDIMACQDFRLYRSFYCGICKVTGKFFGQLPRFSTNYDMTFLNALLHDIAKTPLVFENKGCVCNIFKKKITVKSNSMMDKVVSANIILSYHKALDGVIDKEGVKMRVAKSMLSRAYKKAIKITPEIDEITKKWYGELRELELKKCASLDRVADCFANLLKFVTACLLDSGKSIDKVKDLEIINKPKECVVETVYGDDIKYQEIKKSESECTCQEAKEIIVPVEKAEMPFVKTEITEDEEQVYYDSILSLSYNIGKFVYIADAIDDIEEDFEKKHYNPFLERYGDFTTRANFLANHKDEIDFLLNSTVNKVIENYNNISYRLDKSKGLCENIIYYGLRAKCEELVTAEKKLPKPKI